MVVKEGVESLLSSENDLNYCNEPLNQDNTQVISPCNSIQSDISIDSHDDNINILLGSNSIFSVTVF